MDQTNQVELDRVAAFRDLVTDLDSDMKFGTWLRIMAQLQEVAYGAHYDEFDPETRGDSIMMNLLAAQSEITEMGQEMGWKPWATPRGWVNRDAAIAEAVDIMHFLANLLKHCRCTGEELGEAYKAKLLKNLDRQLEGYDGVSEKCLRCKRELPKGRGTLYVCICDYVTRVV